MQSFSTFPLDAIHTCPRIAPRIARGTVPGWMQEGGLSPDSSLAGGRAVYDIVVRPPSGLQFHDVAVVATDAIADDIRRVMGILGRR